LEQEALKLLGPSAVVEALTKDEKYAERKTLLSSAGGVREGDKILYRIGDHDVYVIPVYTAKAGGVITELGLVAVVGAYATGETFIGLGSTPEEAFSEYLAQLGGIDAPQIDELGAEDRIDIIESIILNEDLGIVEPSMMTPDIAFFEGNATYKDEVQRENAQSLLESFVDDWGTKASGNRIIKWYDDNAINYGILVNVQGVVEMHYISIFFQ
jgi:hypothetical protein